MGRNLVVMEEDSLDSCSGVLVLAFLAKWPFLAVLAKWLNFVFLAKGLSCIEELELLLRALSSLGVGEIDAPSLMKLSNEFMRRE